jgi:hypothetical protein
VREAIGRAVGSDLLGSDTDDFCGALETLRAAVGGSEAEARARLSELEARLATLADRLGRWEEAGGATLCDAYASSEKESSPSDCTR